MVKRRNQAVLLVVVALLWRVAFFSIGAQEVNLSGDEAIRSLQAISIAQPKDSYQVKIQQEPPGLFDHYPLLFMAQPYLFPVESYLSAPFTRLLPRNTFGSRLIPALMGLVTFLLSFLLLNRAFTERQGCREEDSDNSLWRNIASLLVVFPSTFVLVLQVAYPLPSYQAFMMFGMLALWLAELNRSLSWKNPLYALAAGFSAALATSNSLLALPLLAAVTVMVSVGHNWRKALVGSVSCCLGIAAGLLPYFLAKAMYPGAHAAVSGMVHWSVALKRFWEPAVTYTLPIAMGMRSPLIPGWNAFVGVIPEPYLPLFAYLWAALIVCALICSIYCFVGRLRRQKWPEVTVWDVMIGLSVGYLFLFVFSTRFSAREFRYLMPVALFFPFIVAWLISISKGGWRYLFAIIALGVVCINIGTSSSLLRAWMAKDFDGGFVDTRPAVAWLVENKVGHCYSSYMDTYTLNYFANEQVICAQPYNQRFPGWPLPYARVVDNAPNVAFVLGPGKRFSPDRFEHELHQAGVAFQLQTAGRCRIYSDFVAPPRLVGTRVDPQLINVRVSNHQEDADSLADGIFTHKWRSHGAQKKGMWIELELPEVVSLQQLKFYYNGYPHDYARSLDIFVRRLDGSWKLVKPGVGWKLETFDFVNNHPVYANRVQYIEMNGARTDAVRIEIAVPNPGRDWTIGEIEVQSL